MLQVGSHGGQSYLLTGTQVISVSLAVTNGSRYLTVNVLKLYTQWVIITGTSVSKDYISTLVKVQLIGTKKFSAIGLTCNSRQKTVQCF